MLLKNWLTLFQSPVDVIGLVLFIAIFPVYHGIYPWLMRSFPNRAAKVRFDSLRKSWIQGLLDRRDIIAAAQQTRNLTMVNSLLASSSLILMGLTANVLIRSGEIAGQVPHAFAWDIHPDTVAMKLFLLLVVFAVAFAYCMTSLRHLGHFNLIIGADPKLVEEYEGSATEYFSVLINRASNRHTLAVRCLYSASPLFIWLFDSWFFLALTVFWAIKFVGFQDFAHVLKAKSRAKSQTSD